MAKPFKEWTVLPHGALGQVDEKLLTVTGFLRMPLMGDVPRRMTVARLADGRLVIFSAIALAEPEMTRLEAFGRPAFLIIPNSLHRMDAAIWKQRYPTIEVIAPAGAREKVEEVVRIDATQVELGDPSVHFVTVPGTATREAALVVDSESGTTLVSSDLIFNLGHRSGVRGLLGRMLGMTDVHPHMPKVIRMRQVADPTALSTQLERWSELPRLRRILVGHGNPITDQPAAVLRRLAAELRQLPTPMRETSAHEHAQSR
jgi:hypothetical protein